MLLALDLSLRRLDLLYLDHSKPTLFLLMKLVQPARMLPSLLLLYLPCVPLLLSLPISTYAGSGSNAMCNA